jgi:hypothetical protein
MEHHTPAPTHITQDKGCTNTTPDSEPAPISVPGPGPVSLGAEDEREEEGTVVAPAPTSAPAPESEGEGEAWERAMIEQHVLREDGRSATARARSLGSVDPDKQRVDNDSVRG